MFCYVISVDNCAPVYLSILTNTIGFSLLIGVDNNMKYVRQLNWHFSVIWSYNEENDIFLRGLFVAIIGEINSNELFFGCNTLQLFFSDIFEKGDLSTLNTRPKKWPAFKVLTCGDFWDFSSAKLTQICWS